MTGKYLKEIIGVESKMKNSKKQPVPEQTGPQHKHLRLDKDTIDIVSAYEVDTVALGWGATKKPVSTFNKSLQEIIQKHPQLMTEIDELKQELKAVKSKLTNANIKVEAFENALYQMGFKKR